MKIYPQDELKKETAFLAYYFHWSLDEIYALEHEERRAYCSEVSGIHKVINNEPKNLFDE